MRGIIKNKLWFILLCFWAVLTVPTTWAATEQKPQYTNEELLSKMLVLGVTEQYLHNVPALTITFSQDLPIELAADRFITLTQGGKLVRGSWVQSNNSRRLYFTNIEPEKKYRVQIRPGLSAKSGLKLEKASDIEIKTRSVKPSFDFATKGSILPAKLTSGLPIRVVNTPELDIEFLRVKPENLKQVIQRVRSQNLDIWDLNAIEKVTSSVYQTRYKTDAKPNANETFVLPVEDIKELQEAGLYFAVMRKPGRYDNSDYRITHFVISNIGLHVRLYENQLKVFANTLDQGQPLANLSLTLQGKKKKLTATTDEKGEASFAQLPKSPLLLIAQDENSIAFLDLSTAALDLSEYTIGGEKSQAIRAFIYGNRDLYRPNETVPLSIVLRDSDGLPTQIKHLNWRIVRPDAKIFKEETLGTKQTDLGFFQTQVHIPADAPTGTWYAEVRLGVNDKTPISRYAFQVEEFLPERMSLKLEGKESVALYKDSLTIKAQGDYLYGAPASGNKLSSRYSTKLLRHPVKEAKDFYFGATEESKQLPKSELKDIKLDQTGAGKLAIPKLPKTLKHSPITVRVLASLHEQGGRAINRSVEQAVWPAENLVGIRPLFDEHITPENQEAQFEIAHMNATGKKLAANDLHATLVRINKEYFWEYSNATGWKRNHTTHEYPLTQKVISIETGKTQKVAFPVDYGIYRLELENKNTQLKTTYNFHAGWKWSEGGKGAKPNQVQMTLDKPAYKAGDTALLTAIPPHAGDAIVTVEGDGLLWSKRLAVKAESTQIEIPVDADWARHDLYVSMLVLRPASKAKKITPNRAIGLVHLPLDRSDRKVKLSIEAPEKIRPEQKQTIKVKAPELSGEKAVVTISAVDVGVLNITNFKTPDPFNYYFKRQRYAVNQYDAYHKVIESVEGKTLKQRFGGGNSKQAGGQSRAEVEIAALFSGVLEFNEQGEAQVTFDIPPFDGALRLSAIAVSSKQFGRAEQDMLVSSPVVATLSSARFLANGDQTFAVVDLNNTTDTEQSVELTIEVNDALSMQPLAQTNYILQPKQRQVIRIPITASNKIGAGLVKLRLTGKDFVANRKVSFNVRPAYPAQTQISRWTLNNKTEQLPIDVSLLDGLIPETVQANLSLSPTPMLNVRSALDNLLRYPYGCLEQTTSTAYPYLYLESDLVEALALKPIDQKTRRERVQAAIARLAGMQLSNGNFTLWGSYGSEEYWLTPYVLNFLLDARDQGFKVPPRLLNTGLKALTTHLNEGYRSIRSRYRFADKPEHLDFASRAFAAYVLARESKASLGTLRSLYDKDASKAASHLPLIHMSVALQKMGDKRRAKEALNKALVMQRDKKAYLGDYGSVIRDEAMTLRLLLQQGEASDAVAQRVQALSTQIYEREYFSTQEQVAIFLLSQQLFQAGQQAWAAELGLQGLVQTIRHKGIYNQRLNANDLQQAVKVKTSDTLYAGLSVSAYPQQAPAPRSDVIDIKRKWYNLNGEPVATDKVKAGELLLTHLHIKAKQKVNDALVVDLLPAGFELENTNLTDSADLSSMMLKDINQRLGSWLGNADLKTEEFREDRYVAALSLNKDTDYHLFYLARVVSVGEFTVPPSFVEDMYRPELFGMGKSVGRINIAQP